VAISRLELFFLSSERREEELGTISTRTVVAILSFFEFKFKRVQRGRGLGSSNKAIDAIPLYSLAAARWNRCKRK